MWLTQYTIRDILSHEVKGGDKLKPVAERIKEARIKKGLTVKQLAAACHISPSAVQMYECGQRVPRDELKVALANALGERVQDLFF